MATNLTNTTFSTTYKDDFVDSDNYHRILFNSGRVVQARELTQAQTILQKQIERLGNNIFQEGAMVKAGGVTVNNSYEFIKLDTSSNALPADPSTLVGTTFQSQAADGIKVEVLQVQTAAQTGSDAALYVRYTFTQGATAGATSIKMPDATNISNGSITLTTKSSGATGTGIVINVQNGIFYAKGNFVFTEDQSLIVSHFSDNFTGTVGFKVIEDVVTVTDNSSLYDNQGAVANTAAPGADRYRIRLSLIDESNIASSESFIFLAELQNGGVVRSVNAADPFNVPQQIVAQRIKENSGDYLIKQFTGKFEEDSANTHLLLKMSDGVAVIDGFRVSRGPSAIRVSKSTNVYSRDGQVVPAAFGNFVKVSSAEGATNGLPNIGTFEQLDIQDSAAFHGGSTAKLGTARVRAISEDGADYRYHLFDIKLDANKSFRNAKSIGSDSNNWFNITLENNIAVLNETQNNNLLFALPGDRPANIDDIRLTTQRFEGNVSVGPTADGSKAVGSLTTLSGSETFTNSGDWVIAKNDSALFTGLRSITDSIGPGAGATQAKFFLDSAANGTYEAAYYVRNTAGTIRTKTLETNVTKLYISPSTNDSADSDGNGLISLGTDKTDLFRLIEVKDSASGLQDYSSRFIFDNGQRDNFYDEGRLILKGGQSLPTGKIFIKFDHFSHNATGNFFALNSYDSAALGGYKNIPTHTLDNGTIVSLSDVLDFRPVKNPLDGTFVGGISRINELPQPNDFIEFDAEYYLQQSGKIVLTNEGKIEFIEGDNGAPAISFPEAPVGTMGLYNVILGANTLTDSDLTIQPIDHKRFTMKDIARLEKRIDRLEEATTLSLLEIDTNHIEVLDSNGLNRTRSGFVVENFETQILSDTRNPDYAASIDPFGSFLHPTFHEDNIRLVYDSAASTNMVKKGDNVYIDYDSATFLDASKASTAIIMNPFDFAQYNSIIKLSPSSDEWRDTETRTGKVIDGGIELDTKQAYLWNNHEWNWNGKDLEDLKTGSRTSNTKKSIFNKVVSDETVRKVVGEKVVDTVLLPFMRQKKIYFQAKGLRPNTQHFAFFDRSPVASFVREETFVRYADDVTDYGNTKKNITAHPETASILVSDSDGTIEGSFFIKAQTFRSGTVEFNLLDVTAFNRDVAQSTGVGTFTSAGLLDTIEQDIKSTRVLTIKKQKVAPPPKPAQRTSRNNRGDGRSGHKGVAYAFKGGRLVKVRNTDGSKIGSGTKADVIGGTKSGRYGKSSGGYL